MIPLSMKDVLGKQARRNKYGVRTDAAGKRARTVDGILFDSKAEAKRYSELKLLLKAGKILSLLTQFKYPLLVNETVVGTYRADFVYREKTKSGERLVIEDVKGCRTREFILKKKLVKAIYGIDIVEVGKKKPIPASLGERAA
jgi:hypothetical protein